MERRRKLFKGRGTCRLYRGRRHTGLDRGERPLIRVIRGEGVEKRKGKWASEWIMHKGRGNVREVDRAQEMMKNTV